ncbi:hypothetical protein D3C78_1454690 [compost metagenome]
MNFSKCPYSVNSKCDDNVGLVQYSHPAIGPSYPRWQRRCELPVFVEQSEVLITVWTVNPVVCLVCRQSPAAPLNQEV